MRIASIGDTGIDQYLNLGLRKPGGIAFNFAVHVLDAGENASLVSVVGNDKDGEELLSLVEKLKLNTGHFARIVGKTPWQKIILEKTVERKFVGYRQGVLRNWQLSQENLSFIAKHDAVFVPLSDGMEHVFSSVVDLKTDAVKIVDFSQDYEFADFDKKDNVITKYCQYFDVNFVGATEKQLPLLKSLSKKYPEKVFVLTLGKKGSVGFLDGKKFLQPAKNVKHPVDTTGCGDAFQAGFSVNYLKTRNLPFSLQFAAEQAALVTQYLGSVLFSL